MRRLDICQERVEHDGVVYEPEAAMIAADNEFTRYASTKPIPIPQKPGSPSPLERRMLHIHASEKARTPCLPSPSYVTESFVPFHERELFFGFSEEIISMHN